MQSSQSGHYKDAVLENLARRHNIAQFVSFSPGYPLKSRFCRIKEINRPLEPDALLDALLTASIEASVNVRSFDPEEPKAREFIYGLRTLDDALAAVRSLADKGLFTIVNETIDIHDGGISGVSLGGVVEFSSDDTPRCVEKPGTVSLSVEDAIRMVANVYRVHVDESFFPPGERLEFSIHPLRRGLRDDHVVVWEAEEVARVELEPIVSWPNRFSRMVGDKTFGLLVADLINLPVPFTTVLHRRLAPFSFGIPTGSSETWFRTAPPESVPGLFTTQKGWTDPLPVWKEEEPAAILAQEAVESEYAGALLVGDQGDVVIEGTEGLGDAFMLGTAPPAPLPSEVRDAVMQLVERATGQLGPIRMEWGFDGDRAWVLQLHKGASPSDSRMIFPGSASRYHRFEVSAGISGLRRLVEKLQGTGEGIELVGDVGLTSHFGDIIRKGAIPSRIERLST